MITQERVSVPHSLDARPGLQEERLWCVSGDSPSLRVSTLPTSLARTGLSSIAVLAQPVEASKRSPLCRPSNHPQKVPPLPLPAPSNRL